MDSEQTIEPGDEDQRVEWPDEVDEILTGDLTAAVGMPTPKRGVVLATVTPMGIRDRTAGSVGFTTSLGFGRKLERIAADPRISMLYHSREHGFSSRPGIVLVQGVASIRAEIDDDEREALRAQATEHVGQVVEGRFWDWWLSTYYEDRVVVDVHARRVLWWPDGNTARSPEVFGAPIPDEAPSEHEDNGRMAEPRVPMKKVAAALRKPYRILGVLQADGIPLLLPFRLEQIDDAAVQLGVDSPLVPSGARRAGVLAHEYRAKLIGLSTATHTGWLSVNEDGARWTPHTRHAFSAPSNKILLLLANGAAARWGYRQAIKQGRDEIIRHAQPR